MDAEFKDVQEVFSAHGLRLPTLNILIPDAHLYQAFLIQPGGEIAAREDFVGHADHVSAVRRFSHFLRLAVEHDHDVVFSPEYSCPWEAFENAIRENRLPNVGKIWVLGCESITRDELQRVKDSNRNVEWIHESIPGGAGHFLDVLAYVTKAEMNAGGTKDVILLQFKTQAMGGDDTFERDRLIRGRTIYIWHNPQANIRLMSLICSETLVFDEAAANECQFDLYSYLIFHPQLTENPHHIDISAYRRRLYAQNMSEDIEILKLNWARGVIIPGKTPNNYGGSAIYTKSPQFEFSDERLEANGQKGLFYTYWRAHRTNLCFFSFDQHIFQYQIPKTLQNVLASLAQRSGPEMRRVWSWNEEAMTWQELPRVDDGFAALCVTFNEPVCDYCLNVHHTTIDRERLLTLSTGRLERTRDWHNVQKMDCFATEADERSKRLTFTHEQAPASNAFRTHHLAGYIRLQMTVLATPTNFPPTIDDLKHDWRLQPPCEADAFRFNLVSATSGAQGAIAIFLGLVPPNYAHQLMDDLIRAWGKIETRRLVIWYEFQNNIVPIHPPLPSITDDLEPPASITHTTDP